MRLAAYQTRPGMGVLVLDRRKEQVFPQQEIDFVRQIANQVAIVEPPGCTVGAGEAALPTLSRSA